MTISSGSDIDPADFISTSAGAADSGKVPKLNSVGRLDKTFGALADFTSVKSHSAFLLSTIGNMTNAGGGNTILHLGRVIIPNTILQCTKVTFGIQSHTTNGTVKIALFSEDGQTQIFSFTTATITAAGNVSTTITATDIPAGVYYIGFLDVGTTNTTPIAIQGTNVIIENVASEPVYTGYLTVTASTMPATITPTSITFELNNTLYFQLDK